MKQSSFLRLAFLLFFAVALSGSVAARSTDRDHPTPLKSNEIVGDLDASGNEYFYSFLAGPGELTITVDVKSSTGQALLNFELLDRNAAASIICCEYAQAEASHPDGGRCRSKRVINSRVAECTSNTHRLQDPTIVKATCKANDCIQAI